MSLLPAYFSVPSLLPPIRELKSMEDRKESVVVKSVENKRVVKLNMGVVSLYQKHANR